MARCEAKHPLTDKQCTGEAGHVGGHDPEPFSQAEREVIAGSMRYDIKGLIDKWTDSKFPVAAMSGTFFASFVMIETDVCEHSTADMLRNVIQCLADRELADVEIFQFIAKQFGLPCETLAAHVGTGKKYAVS